MTRKSVLGSVQPPTGAKIEHFLHLKGVPEALIRERLDEEHWMDHAYRVWQKKFGSARDTSSLAEKAKQQRFMQIG